MKILGIHFHTHNTSVALIENGVVRYAADNERFSRKKMDTRPPILAIRDCFRYCKIQVSEIDILAFSGDSPLIALKKFIEDSWWLISLTGGRYPFWYKNPLLIVREFILGTGVPSYILRYLIPYIRIRIELLGFRGKVIWVPHHYCHVSSAFYTTGWKDCLVAIVEGAGYHESTSFWQVINRQPRLLAKTEAPHSAGRFYELVTLLLGFNRIRHSGKITGLAAFGNPNAIAHLTKKLLWVENYQLRMDYNSYFKWMADYLTDKSIPNVFKGYSREDIAAGFQKRLEDCVVELVKKMLKKTGQTKIALAGGVIANVKLNQKIHEIMGVKEIRIHQGMGDEGLALGAALHASNTNGESTSELKDVYLGPDYSDLDIRKALKKAGLIYKKVDNIERRIAQLIADNKIVARFNGRMEYGPRALGNRSILYQAKDKSVNDWLNKRLKRTEFMPFAPVTLEDYAKRCYLGLKGAEYSAHFMTITFYCTPFMHKNCPAVVHVDGTARPQLINVKHNPSYYRILKEYYKITKIPTLVNTSFNMHEEPIVCSPDDAIRSFLAGNLDYLAIGNYLVEFSSNKMGVKRI